MSVGPRSGHSALHRPTFDAVRGYSWKQHFGRTLSRGTGWISLLVRSMSRMSATRVWAAFLRGSGTIDLLQVGGVALIVLPVLVGVWYLIADLLGIVLP